jgi:hypothetical protein
MIFNNIKYIHNIIVMEQEFIMLIMNCKKYQEKANYQKTTWLPNIPDYLRFYHVIGDTELESSYKFDNEANILWVKVADDYNSLPKKVIASYEAVYETFNFRYLFKTDDDQILVNQKFFDIVTGLIRNKTPKTHYGGYIVDIPKPYLSEYHRIHPELPKHLPLYMTTYCSGRFYFLSKSAVTNLLSKRERIEREYLEDYAIGFNLDEIYKKDILSLATNKFFIDIEVYQEQEKEKVGKKEKIE